MRRPAASGLRWAVDGLGRDPEADVQVFEDLQPALRGLVVDLMLGWRYCVGCARTLDEIARWGEMIDAERCEVLARLDARRAARSTTQEPAISEEDSPVG